MKKTSNITFLLFSGNEEKRIEYPIKCFLPYGEVIVFLDEKSTDKTALMAKKLGAKVVKRPKMQPDFVETKQMSDFVYQYIKTDWVFWGFADEMVPKPCLELYKKISQESKYKIVVQKKKTLLYTKGREYLPCYVGIKFFRKDAIDFSNNKIHQMGKFKAHVKPSEVLYLPPIDEYCVYHFQTQTTETWLKNFNAYSNIHAQSISPKSLGFKILFDPLFSFLNHYFFDGAFRYGIEGFIVSVEFAFYSFMVLAKTYEIKNNITLNSEEKEFAQIKKYLLARSPKSSWWQKLIANLKIAIIAPIHKNYKFNQLPKE